jgi:hypothetical protein
VPGDIEDALTEHLSQFGTCITDQYVGFTDDLPVLVITRIGGGNDKNNDYPTVAIDSYTSRDYQNPRAGWQLASDVVEYLNDTVGVLVKGCLIDEVSTDSGPTNQPYPDPAIQVYRTVYQFTVRG